MAGEYASELGNFPDVMKLYAPGESSDIRALKVQFYDAWLAWKQSDMGQRPPKESWETDEAGNLTLIDREELTYWERNGWLAKLPDMSFYDKDGDSAGADGILYFSLGDVIKIPGSGGSAARKRMPTFEALEGFEGFEE
ncbi:MAG: hypothetical protein V1813_00655, partial [Candidatus Aenigmatarchaeota archaeon]